MCWGKREMCMRKFKILKILVFSALGIFTGCKHTSDTKFVAPEFPVNESATFRILSKDVVVPIPHDMQVTDSSVILLGLMDGYWFHEYNKVTGELMKQFIRSGNGPGELINAISFRNTADTLSVYDSNRQEILHYLLDDGHCDFLNRIDLRNQMDVIRNVILVDGTEFLIEGGKKDSLSYRTLKWIAGNFEIAEYSQLPIKKEYRYALLNNAQFVISPDKKHVGISSLYGGILETLEFDRNKLASLYSGLLFPVAFDEEDGIPTMNKEQSEYGFTALCGDNKHLIGAFIGDKDISSPTSVGIWDWDGTTIKSLSVNCQIARMALDPCKKNRLYAVIAGDNMDISLAYIDL